MTDVILFSALVDPAGLAPGGSTSRPGPQVRRVKCTPMTDLLRLELGSTHHGRVSQPLQEPDDYESWRVLQEVLEERDREWWAEAREDD